MSEVIKAYIGIFLIFFLVFSSVTMIASALDAQEARSFENAVIREAENSGYSTDVLNACGKDAVRHHYKLKVILYHEDGRVNDLDYDTKDQEYSMDVSDVGMAQIRLRYPYRLCMFHQEIQHEICGLA